MIMKHLRKQIVLMLLVALTCGCCFGFLNFRSSVVKAFEPYEQPYSEIGQAELDRLTFRNSVSTEAPQITVLTHGLSGRPSHWASNDNYIFAYEAESLPEQLRKRNRENGKDTVIYRVRLSDIAAPQGTKAELLSENVSDTSDTVPDTVGDAGAASLRAEYLTRIDDGSSIDLNICEEGAYSNDASNHKDALIMNDVTKHIVLIFEAQNVDESNDHVYAQFEYILDAVSYQYYQLTGTLPTYNLIGHSRGGITNLQYALAHPYNVASLYSMGTPYNGSAFGGVVDGSGYRRFLKVADMHRNYTYQVETENGERTETESDYDPGVLDILNQSLNDSYRNFWNDHYDFYRHINFRPIGSYVTLGFILQALAENAAGNKKPLEKFLRVLTIVVDVKVNFKRFDNKKKLAEQKLTDYIIDGLKALLVKGFGVPNNGCWFHIVNNLRSSVPLYKHIGFSLPSTVYYADDLFVDIDSQVAYQYKGADRRVKMLDYVDQQRGKKTINNVGVGHNLETHDKEIIQYIVKTLPSGEFSNNNFTVRYEEAGAVITSYTGSHNNVTIPGEINGVPVIGIDGLVSDKQIGADENGEVTKYLENIQSVTIPASVTKIEDYAFYGMSGLKYLNFPEDSKITSIGKGAFQHCTSLQSVTLPPSLEALFNDIFVGCEQLSSISIHSDNQNFITKDGILYSKNQKYLIAYPQGKKDENFTVPDTVTEITDYAFYGNTFLKSIDLKNTEIIQKFAFYGCENLEKADALSLLGVGVFAFDETKMADNAQEELKFGNVFYRYGGTKEILSEESFYKMNVIADYAFRDNENLKEIFIPSNVVQIGSLAFGGCENLRSVTFYTNCLPDIKDDTFLNVGADFKIYAPRQTISSGSLSDEWKALKEDGILVPISTEVYFEDIGKTVTYYYGEEITLPENPKKAGFKFLGWFLKEDGNVTPEMLDRTEWKYKDSSKTYVAKWREIKKYQIRFYQVFPFSGNGDPISDPDRYSVYNMIYGGEFAYDFTDIALRIDGEVNYIMMTYCWYTGKNGPVIALNYGQGSAICSFAGWYMVSDGKLQNKRLTSGILSLPDDLDDDIIYICAKWEPILYEVTYQYNCADYSDRTEKYHYFQDMPLEILPDKGNRYFLGWQSGEETIETLQGQRGDIVINAVWQYRYTVRYYYSKTNKILIKSSYIESKTSPATINLLQLGYRENTILSWKDPASVTRYAGDRYSLSADTDFYGFSYREKTISETYNQENGYYEIWTLKHLKQLNAICGKSSNKIKLMADISIPSDEKWTTMPVNYATIDFNYKTIRNLNWTYDAVNFSALHCAGLFSVNHGTIKNLCLMGVSVKYHEFHEAGSDAYVGGVVGNNYGTIENCYVQGSIEVHRVRSRLGGIVGCNRGIVRNCRLGGERGSFDDSDLTSYYSYIYGNGDIGGIAGYNRKEISRCRVYNSDIRLYVYQYNKCIGGIVGWAQNNCTISDCSVNGVYVSFMGNWNISSSDLNPQMGLIVGALDSSSLNNFKRNSSSLVANDLKKKNQNNFGKYADQCIGQIYGDSIVDGEKISGKS